MIDYFHTVCKGQEFEKSNCVAVYKGERLNQNNLEDEIRKTTLGENISYQIKGCEDIDIRHQPKINSTYISGSIHKFWNWTNGKGSLNWNRFSYPDCLTAIDTISEIHGILPERQTLKGYEFGYNLPVSFDPKVFIQDHVICHRNKFSSDDKSYGRKGYYSQYIFDQYRIKLYDKGKQEQLKENLLRIEIKVVKSAYHGARKDLQYLSDLKNPEIWQWFHFKLTKSVESLLVLDEPKSPSNIKNSNPNHWKFMKRDSRMSFYRKWNSVSKSLMKSEILYLMDCEFKSLNVTNSHQL